MQPKNDRTKKKFIHYTGPLATMYERDGYRLRYVRVDDPIAYEKALSCGYTDIICDKDAESNKEVGSSFQSRYIEKPAGKTVGAGTLRLMEISEEDYQAMCKDQMDANENQLNRLRQELNPQIGSINIEHKK